MPTRTYGTACVACRIAKVKCNYMGSDSSGCNRCVRTGRTCKTTQTRRRHNTAQLDVRSNTSGDLLARTQELVDQERQPNNFGKRSDAPQVGANTAPSDDLNKQDNSRSVNHGVAWDSASTRTGEETMSVFTPPSFVSRSDDTRDLSLDSALNPTRRLRAATIADRAEDVIVCQSESLPRDDPVTMLILNRPSAQHLIEGYFAHFEYNVGFLDPILYTFDYIRTSSSLLFTTLLAISSRVFRPDLYTALRAHMETLLSGVLLSCNADIENIWAIVCMYYWKDIADKRGYVMIGFAMRLAASSQWSASKRAGEALQGLNATESQVRKQRDRERVWLYLSSLDRTLSFFTDRPLSGLTIPEEIASRTWLQISHPWTYSFGDARALAGEELNIISKPMYSLIRSSRAKNTLSEVGKLTAAMKAFDAKMLSWSDYWAPRFSSCRLLYYVTAAQKSQLIILRCKVEDTASSLEPQIYMYCNHIRTYFNCVLLHRTLIATNYVVNAEVTTAAKTCYETALATLKQAIVLGRLELLYYLWDTAHLMIAYTAMVLLKLVKQIPECPGICFSDALDVVQELAEMHSVGTTEFPLSTGREPEGSQAGGSTMEAQARLLKTITVLLKVEIIPLQSMSTMNYGGRDDGISDNWLSSDLQVPFLFPKGPMANQAQGIQPTSAVGLFNPEIVTDGIAFPLDSEGFETWFTDAGLLPWDKPGMFRNNL